jgi:hypothetical protein
MFLLLLLVQSQVDYNEVIPLISSDLESPTEIVDQHFIISCMTELGTLLLSARQIQEICLGKNNKNRRNYSDTEPYVGSDRKLK